MTDNALDYLLWITNSQKNLIGAEFADQCLSIIEKIKSRNYTADELYSLVTDDELYICAEKANGTNDEVFRQAFISVLMCMICAKYHNEGQMFLPEDIEPIQGDKLDGFFTYLKEKRPLPKDCYEIFCRTVCL